MVLGSHNSWSYIKPTKWWMNLIRFTAKCQNKDIQEQYNLGVRYFDLRLRFDEDLNPLVVHGKVIFDVGFDQVTRDLEWLNSKADTTVRVLLDVRTKKDYTDSQREQFNMYCAKMQNTYKNIQFDCGRNLYDWTIEYDFNHEYSVEDMYASVAFPKIIDDWLPILYAKLHNRSNIQRGTDKDVLLIDFVDVQ